MSPITKLGFPGADKGLNYFREIGSVVDEVVGGLAAERGKSSQEIAFDVNASLRQMQSEWFSQGDPQIDYSDPLARLAYIYCHVPANANLCEIAIRDTPSIASMVTSRISAGQEIKVGAFGGGPGTELLAFAKHLLHPRGKAPRVRVSFTLIDRVSEWSDSLTRFKSAIERRMSRDYGESINWPLTISYSTAVVDLFDESRWRRHTQLFTQDIYVLSYFVSELGDRWEDAQPLINRISEAAPVGAIFLVIDRNESRIQGAAQQLLTGPGLLVSQVTLTNRNMDDDEQAGEMGTFASINFRRPKLQWDAFWVTGTKH